jgi:hypothetical protein
VNDEHRSRLARTPTCEIDFRNNGVEATVRLQRQVIDRARIADITRAEIESLIATHSNALADGWHPNPFDRWASATERFLAESDRLLVSTLRPLILPWPRIGLIICNPLLGKIPWESAHQPGETALLEQNQVFRTTLAATERPATRRRFRFECHAGNTDGLPAIPLEGILASAPYDHAPVGHTERIIHLAGHEPKAENVIVKAHERAHLVLSGCSSLPTDLPPGIESVTASLWDIDDFSNHTTTALLHARIAAGIGPLEGLRQAQIMQRALPPTVWAGYVHFGKPE